jgi:N-methylhydantoinase A
LYERLGPPVQIEVLNWRVVSSGPKPKMQLKLPEATSRLASNAIKGTRKAYFPETNGYADTPVYDRYALTPGAVFTGPAIVEERESTVVIGPGARCEIDERHNLVVGVGGRD